MKSIFDIEKLKRLVSELTYGLLMSLVRCIKRRFHKKGVMPMRKVKHNTTHSELHTIETNVTLGTKTTERKEEEDAWN